MNNNKLYHFHPYLQQQQNNSNSNNNNANNTTNHFLNYFPKQSNNSDTWSSSTTLQHSNDESNIMELDNTNELTNYFDDFIEICDNLIPYHICMHILCFLSIKDLCQKALLLNKTINSFIINDKENILWDNFTSIHGWLRMMINNNLKDELKRRKRKWMRFLSIFADNYCEFEIDSPSSSLESSGQQQIYNQHLKLFDDKELAFMEAMKNSKEQLQQTILNNNGQSTTTLLQPTIFESFNNNEGQEDYNSYRKRKIKNQTVLVIGQQNMNVSFCGNYKIQQNTVKYFELNIDEKHPNWNIGIGLSERNFIQLKRKFVGFGSQTFGYSSNGFIREFSSKCQNSYIQSGGFENYGKGDRIGMLIDMFSNTCSIYLNGNLIHTFKNVYLVDNVPLRITCTLHCQNDQISLDIQNKCCFSRNQLLSIYDELESTLDKKEKALREVKRRFKELSKNVLENCNDLMVMNELVNQLENSCKKNG
ncbi:hypothetical protein ABK040_005479 [Willaertia magna]